VGPGAALGDGNLTLAEMGDTPEEEIGATVAPILAVGAGGSSGTGEQAGSDIRLELLAPFVEADQRSRGVGRSLIDVEDVFHGGHKGGTRLVRQTPFMGQPRLERVFY
ncbi:MAG TPA: hypothetical protein VMY40_14525, partial [Anaerolineae bacterium]|nr:hypothetical protein [Anaerolineae bacterium]